MNTLKRNVLFEKQLFPKHHWCLYFRDETEPDLCFYDGAIAREEAILPDGNVVLTIVDCLGYRRIQWDNERFKGIERLGQVITVPQTKLTSGFCPNSHYEAVAMRIKDIVPNEYLSSSDIIVELARILMTCGVFNFTEQLILNGGIIDARMIEESFCDDSEKYPLFVSDKALFCGQRPYTHLLDTEIISARTAMKRYGHRVLDETYERTESSINDVISPIEYWTQSHKKNQEFEIQSIKNGSGFKNIFGLY